MGDVCNRFELDRWERGTGARN